MHKIDEKQLKIIELELLNYFKTLCNRYNLSYYLAYGTLLGAIRHAGFIPWDDDIDLMMPRKDYKKLCNIMKNIKNRYKLLSIETNKEYNLPLAKIIDSNTILKQSYNYNEKPELGVYIDIFILDGLPEDEKQIDKILRKEKILRIYWAMAIRKIDLKGRNMLISLCRDIISLPFKIIGPRYFARKMNKIASKYCYDKSRIIGVINFGEGERDIFEKHVIEGNKEASFEGELYKIPTLYQEYLCKIYGNNYMTIPEPENRISKHNFRAYLK